MIRNVIIDTDPGVDDAIAIFLALASAKLNILGLTTIFGNADVQTTTRNALVILDVAGQSNIPVIPGAEKPLHSEFLGGVPQVHGHNGLGDASLQSLSTPAIDDSAPDWLYKQAKKMAGKVTILALGPLTNLAIAMKRYPDFPDLVENVVIMGGNAIVPGNASPAAEANILNDPEAADLVFGGAWPITMVGLDVTHQVNLKGDKIRKIAHDGNDRARFLSEILPLYRDFFETTNKIDGIYLHDPSAVAYLMNPDLFTTNKWPIRVETKSFSRGKTWPSLGDTDDEAPKEWQGRPLISVCVDVDAQKVINLLVDHLA